MRSRRDVQHQLEQSFGTKRVGSRRSTEQAAELPIVTIDSVEMAQELVRWSADRSLRLAPVGFGSQLDRGAFVMDTDLLVSTRGWTGVTTYESGDGTLTARAGSTLHELVERARSGGHHLTPRVARGDARSLGGVIGSAAKAYDRLRCGPLRDNLLGATVVCADGRVSKSGGALVKNVTGYDLPRLWCGSRGALCIVLEASLRLWPLPEVERLVQASSTSWLEAIARARLVRDSLVRPWCVEIRTDGEGRTITHFALAGRASVVELELETLRDLLDSIEVFDGPDPHERLREGVPLRDGEKGLLACTTVRPSHLAERIESLEREARALDLAAELRIQPFLASVEVSFSADDFEPVNLWARNLTAQGIELEWNHAQAELIVAARIPAAAADLADDLARSLDPRGVFAR